MEQGGEAAVAERRERCCPKCGSTLQLKRTRDGGHFLACPRYPACKHGESAPLGVACPQSCGGELLESLRRDPVEGNRSRRFVGCSGFETEKRCNFAVWAAPVREPCPACSTPFVVEDRISVTGVRRWCAIPGCGYNEVRSDFDLDVEHNAVELLKMIGSYFDAADVPMILVVAAGLAVGRTGADHDAAVRAFKAALQRAVQHA